ncbi:MAG: ComEC family DNA internalization-related competence protein, partial [Clostridia bacterium]|nr:ComEC family DNA internalization-related competence protein [Clostridia bacterium]
MKRPMIWCAVLCIVLSICVFYLNTTVITALATLSFILLVIFCIVKRTRKIAILIAVAFLFLLNTARLKINYIDKLKVLNSDVVTINAVITDVGREKDYFSLKVKVTDSDGELPKDTKLRLNHYKDGVEIGNEITADIKLSGLNDSVYKKANYSNGIFAVGYIKEITNKEYGDNIYHRLQKFKTAVNNILFSNMSYTHASFATALTVGDSSYIDDDLYRCVRAGGVSHVIVVSGMHMAIICGSIHMLLNKVRFNRQLSAVFT